VVLLVEDSPGDVRLMQEAFREVNPPIQMHVTGDGVDAMSFLRREDVYANSPRPDLILLDLNMPRMDGRAVLAQIKADDDLKTIPTVILTTSSDEGDIFRSYQGELLPVQAGGVGRVRKPCEEHQRVLADHGQGATGASRVSLGWRQHHRSGLLRSMTCSQGPCSERRLGRSSVIRAGRL
jgi:CheY-like chemotaxis protein